LVTNAINFLPRVDEIFVIKDGFITESGSYKELLGHKGAFSEFLTQFLQEVEDDEELEEIKESLGETDVKKILERSVSTISGINKSDGGSPTGSLRKRSSRKESARKEDIPLVEIAAPKGGDLMTKEESQTGSVSYKVYLRYFASIGVVFGSMSILLNAASQTFSILSSFWLTQWSSDNSTDPGTRDMYMAVYGAYGVAQALAVMGTSIILAIACLNASRDLHNSLLHRMFRYPMSFFDTTPIGRVLNRFSKDVDTCDNTLPASMRFWLLMFFNVVGVFVVICIGESFNYSIEKRHIKIMQVVYKEVPYMFTYDVCGRRLYKS
jgi:ATP-binding cassette subfamily C (CFTR/MRP) protein 1